MVDKYNETCSQVVRHSKCREDSSGSETKLELKDWSARVSFTLLPVTIGDAWPLNKYYCGSRLRLSRSALYKNLKEELTQNKKNVIFRMKVIRD